MSECPLCSLEEIQLVAENGFAVAFRDAYPVTPLHTLIVPRRHVEMVFDMTREEAVADQLDADLEDLGEKDLKNVPEPVRCYSVQG